MTPTETDPDPAAPTSRGPDRTADTGGPRTHSRVVNELRRLRSLLG